MVNYMYCVRKVYESCTRNVLASYEGHRLRFVTAESHPNLALLELPVVCKRKKLTSIYLDDVGFFPDPLKPVSTKLYDSELHFSSLTIEYGTAR